MGSGFRVWTAGEVVSASNVNNYLQEQTVMSFAGTAARSSAIASPEEGMLSYLQDTDTYQGYDGSAWVNLGTLSGASDSGLIHINTTDFSAVASQSLDNVFSADYKNYKIVGKIELSGNTDPLMRLRVSSADNTTGNYSSSGYKIVGGSGAFTIQAATTSWLIYDTGSTSQVLGFEMLLYEPFVADQTYGTSFSAAGEEGAGGTARSQCLSLFFNNNISFDGFTILGNGSNITGTIRVYGFKD